MKKGARANKATRAKMSAAAKASWKKRSAENGGKLKTATMTIEMHGRAALPTPLSAAIRSVVTRLVREEMARARRGSTTIREPRVS